MPKKTFTPEQIVNTLRRIELLTAMRKTVCPTRARKRGHGPDLLSLAQGVRGPEARSGEKRLIELERENARLKKLVADLSLEKAWLPKVASGN